MSQPQPPQRGNRDMRSAGPVVEPTSRWIRVKFGDVFVADSKRALLLRQYGPGRLPTYCFPQADVRMDLLERTGADQAADDTVYWNVQVGDQIAENAAWMQLEPPPLLADLRGYVTFAWGKMDAWYEEEEQVFVHARDPYKRVDVMASSRHVKVVMAGEVVAETRRPSLLFETYMPTRYYIPSEDVRMDLLEPSSKTTRCPYKGIASYWSVKIGDTVAKDMAWGYLDPIPECPKIRGLLCFFNERVDLFVDSQIQTRPRTAWAE